MTLYLRILSYIKPYMHRLLFAMVCTIMAAAGNLYIPWIIKDMIDEVLADKNGTMLNWIAASIIAIFIVRGLFWYGQNYLMSYVGQSVIIDIRAAVFKKLQRLSVSFYDKNKTGTIMSYVTNDVNALQSAMVENTIEMITEGFILIGSVVAMIYLDWRLTLFTVCTFPVVLWFMEFFGKKIRKTGGRIQECTADITSVLQESVASARVIKSFVREDYEVDRFDVENKANFRANMKNAQLMATLTPVVELVAAIGVTMIIWYGGNNVINGTITAGSLVAFLTYAVNISNPIKRLTRVIGNIQKALAAAQRVFMIIDMPEEIAESRDAKQLPEVIGKVEFQNVSFAYNDKGNVITDLSFSVKPGEVIAIVGPSGAGKSTIANLLPRFYDVNKGDIKIDGHSVREVTLDSLREQVGIVPQETMLFNGSVYNNILYGRLDATKEEIEAAAKAANAHDFIMQLTDGYETKLGDRGVNLSGGQRQRIAIARAILKNPRILILDEATSALDTESERVVQEALDRLMVGRTSFVIAHRLSTVKNADKILVLEKGNLVESGTHDELLALDGLYAHLYKIQYRNKEAK
ncbi:lipid A export permease/ATP-binding protein MsbA [Phascolarctobacterium faecium]|jgi:subfamily B ATP-binding cassette protein MsbA|uniref:lipid A export permease/ATP-binding protein MsbA n=1 Tax=Phascolarctobacterium faecium TaxID=33025 RepID=UPI00242D24F4|nr:lipid A export permease/ATP-binding protein MsbA [Phascolarctobacterium faecium]MBS1316144.1 lipid A export permease/ATP-binding protein MsbA [Acidaminococcaceae bacterium]